MFYLETETNFLLLNVSTLVQGIKANYAFDKIKPKSHWI